MANIYLKQGAKYYIRFRISTVNVDQSKPGVENPDTPWMIEKILPALSTKWDGNGHITYPNHFPLALRNTIDGTQPAGLKLNNPVDRTFWLEAKWKLESGTYCTDAVLSTRYTVSHSPNADADKRDYKEQAIVAKFHDYATEPAQEQHEIDKQYTDLGSKEKIEIHRPLDIPQGSLPVGSEGTLIDRPGSGKSMPGAKTDQPGSRTIADFGKDRASRAEGLDSGRGLERKPSPDAPPLGDDYESEPLEAGGWSDPMRNEPKDEDEESSNTALWVGLGAVGVGALIWWASTQKK